MKRLLALLLLPAIVLGADIQSPETFTDSGSGAIVNAARLGNHVNGATILPTFISDKTATAPVLTDYILFLQTSGLTLKKATVQQLFTANALSSVGIAVPSGFSVSGSPLTASGTITISLASQSANVVLAGPLSGSAATPTWRTLGVADFTPATASVSASDIDWSQSNAFGPKTITGDTTFTFSNVRSGQTIVVCTTQDGSGGHNITWPTVSWSGGTQPPPTTTAGKTDVWTFINVGAVTYGSVTQNF
jgi:hypothetical protein